MVGWLVDGLGRLLRLLVGFSAGGFGTLSVVMLFVFDCGGLSFVYFVMVAMRLWVWCLACGVSCLRC